MIFSLSSIVAVFGFLVLLFIFIPGLFLGTASKSFVCYRTSIVLAQSQYD